jgi:hypothetical protein
VNAFSSLCKFALLVLAASSLFIVSGVDAADADARDWRLSDLRKVIKARRRNLPEIITSFSIIDESTLVVFLVSTRAPLSGTAAEVTLTFAEKNGWKVTKASFMDP